MMKRLAYQSTATADLSGKDVTDILSIAIRFNADHNITGLLLFDGHAFFQIIEGEEGPLLALYESIKTDKRHRDIEMLYIDDAETRDFPDWNMCGTLVPRGLRGPVNAPLFLPERLSDASRTAIDRFIYAEAA